MKRKILVRTDCELKRMYDKLGYIPEGTSVSDLDTPPSPNAREISEGEVLRENKEIALKELKRRDIRFKQVN